MLRKVGEFLTEDRTDDGKILKALASVGFKFCFVEDYGVNGSNYIIMEEQDNDTIRKSL